MDYTWKKWWWLKKPVNYIWAVFQCKIWCMYRSFKGRHLTSANNLAGLLQGCWDLTQHNSHWNMKWCSSVDQKLMRIFFHLFDQNWHTHWTKLHQGVTQWRQRAWCLEACGFIPKKIQWHIHTGPWSLINWVVQSAYETLHKGLMNINEDGCQPWGWPRPWWWSVYARYPDTRVWRVDLQWPGVDSP